MYRAPSKETNQTQTDTQQCLFVIEYDPHSMCMNMQMLDTYLYKYSY